MWKQSPKQSVYDIRLHIKKPRYQKLHGAIGGGPLDPPLSGKRRDAAGKREFMCAEPHKTVSCLSATIGGLLSHTQEGVTEDGPPVVADRHVVNVGPFRYLGRFWSRISLSWPVAVLELVLSI